MWIRRAFGCRGGAATVLRIREKITVRMRILMIAPEPFFEPRGTPFSEFHRIRALTDARASGRSRHVSVWSGRDDGRAAGVSIAAAAVCAPREDRAVVREAAARCAARADGDSPRLQRPLRRDSLARGRRHDRRAAVAPSFAYRICTTCIPACRSSSPISPSPDRHWFDACSWRSSG